MDSPGAMYVPPLAIALVSQIGLTCAHCRSTTLKIWPLMPTLSVLEMLHLRMGLPSPAIFAIAAGIPLLAIVSLVMTTKSSKKVLIAGAITTAILSTVFSFITLAMIRA